MHSEQTVPSRTVEAEPENTLNTLSPGRSSRWILPHELETPNRPTSSGLQSPVGVPVQFGPSPMTRSHKLSLPPFVPGLFQTQAWGLPKGNLTKKCMFCGSPMLWCFAPSVASKIRKLRIIGKWDRKIGKSDFPSLYRVSKSRVCLICKIQVPRC